MIINTWINYLPSGPSVNYFRILDQDLKQAFRKQVLERLLGVGNLKNSGQLALQNLGANFHSLFGHGLEFGTILLPIPTSLPKIHRKYILSIPNPSNTAILDSGDHYRMQKSRKREAATQAGRILPSCSYDLTCFIRLKRHCCTIGFCMFAVMGADIHDTTLKW
jgi:hypothetical protein